MLLAFAVSEAAGAVIEYKLSSERDVARRSRLRTVLLVTWCVYPVSYLMPVLGFDGANAFVGRQIGYTIADITAKCLFGLMIYQIARTKSAEDSKEYAWDEAH